MKRFLNKEVSRNVEKICVNCKYFIRHWPDYDEPINNGDYGRCKLFGEINLVTGKTDYDYAKFVRNNESQCGESGKLFVKDDSKK
jgi:hypothetical protein